MDIEFHYYMTYLIGTRAGIDPDNARLLAYSSQYVDNNDYIFEIDKGRASGYRNYISQTMNILKPKAKLLRIYPIFHFIPGDPVAETARRKDGKLHWLNTTPNSPNANDIMDRAVATGDMYRIGIAAHGFVDTWAHQNFVGYYESFNAMDNPLASATPNIGHADAQHNPDWPALVWKDCRLMSRRVDNRERFLEAATFLLEKLSLLSDPRMSDTEMDKRKTSLIADLDNAIGDRDQDNSLKAERIARYIDLSETAAYGDKQLPEYDEDYWLDLAVDGDVRGLRDKSDFFLQRFDPLADVYTWRDDTTYQQTDWYRFQEAVRQHQDESWDILAASSFKNLDLPNL